MTTHRQFCHVAPNAETALYFPQKSSTVGSKTTQPDLGVGQESSLSSQNSSCYTQC